MSEGTRAASAAFLIFFPAEIAEEIDDELKRAERHGGGFHSLHEAYGVIAEELDEVWDITKLKRKNRDEQHLRQELIQVAAMAIKALQSMKNFVGGEV